MSAFVGKISSLLGFGEKTAAKEVAVDEKALVDKIKNTEFFSNLDDGNVEEMITHMIATDVSAGTKLIRQGEEGDDYFLLVRGVAVVTRLSEESGEDEVLAEIEGPVGFGEDALISNAKRNATITMKTDGLVMRLSKDDFSEYVKDPLVCWLSPIEAQRKIMDGARWLDVRTADKALKQHMHGAIRISLGELRDRMEELDKSGSYISYCQNGRMSSTAAFILSQKGFNIAVLRGGLNSLKRAGMA